MNPISNRVNRGFNGLIEDLIVMDLSYMVASMFRPIIKKMITDNPVRDISSKNRSVPEEKANKKGLKLVKREVPA